MTLQLRVLYFRNIRRCDTFVRRILGEFGDRFLGELEGFSDGFGHGDVDIVVWVVPINGLSSVFAIIWVNGDVVMLF